MIDARNTLAACAAAVVAVGGLGAAHTLSARAPSLEPLALQRAPEVDRAALASYLAGRYKRDPEVTRECVRV